jgi:hypothetical protein
MVVAAGCQQDRQVAKPAPAAAGATSASDAPAKVEIVLASPVKAAIEKATPAEKFAYYVVKGMEPKAAADLVGRTLFVCCRLPLQSVVPIVKAAIPSLKAPQFAGVQAYEIVGGMLSGPGKKPTDPCALLSMDPLGYKGRKVPFTGRELDFCRNATTEPQVLALAIGDMRAAGNGVLLVSRASQAPAPDFAEVVFK